MTETRLRDRDRSMNTARHDVPTSTLEVWGAVERLPVGVREWQRYRKRDLHAHFEFQFALHDIDVSSSANYMPLRCSVVTIARNIWAANA